MRRQGIPPPAGQSPRQKRHSGGGPARVERRPVQRRRCGLPLARRRPSAGHFRHGHGAASGRNLLGRRRRPVAERRILGRCSSTARPAGPPGFAAWPRPRCGSGRPPGPPAAPAQGRGRLAHCAAQRSFFAVHIARRGRRRAGPARFPRACPPARRGRSKSLPGRGCAATDAARPARLAGSARQRGTARASRGCWRRSGLATARPPGPARRCGRSAARRGGPAKGQTKSPHPRQGRPPA